MSSIVHTGEQEKKETFRGRRILLMGREVVNGEHPGSEQFQRPSLPHALGDTCYTYHNSFLLFKQTKVIFYYLHVGEFYPICMRTY